ncbi:kelch domain-containing protein 3-like isoform X2 [Apostichopus japonicus]|uniref:kelch domain-containing protein 3-like isoform X2 n=1 Tax=Stichopus japonicus TaxID=307972 RepID=UPI003AB739B6
MPLWTNHLDGGPRRVNHAATSVGDFIFTFGGYCSGGDYASERPIDGFAFNTNSLRWTTLPPYMEDTEAVLRHTPYMRYGHSVITHNEKIFLWGGRNDIIGADPRLFCFDPKSISWNHIRATGDIPSGTDGHSACEIGNAMYLFGGFVDPLQIYSNMVFMLDLRNNNWRLLQRKSEVVPHWRDFHTATAVGPQMVVFGGRSDQSGRWYTEQEFYCNKVWIFDTRNQQWTHPECSGEPPKGRRSHSAFVHKGSMYVFGGFNRVENTHFNDIYKLDLSSFEWSKVETTGVLPRRRRRQCCVMVKDKMYMFGGTSPQSDDTDNLLDLADLHTLDFSPSLKTMCKVSVLENHLNSSLLPKSLQWELTAMQAASSICSPTDTQQG